MLAATHDPDGRRVVLSEAAWAHIKQRRPGLARSMRDVMTAVHDPTVRRVGRYGGEEWFYLEDAGHLRWLKVVVHYEGG